MSKTLLFTFVVNKCIVRSTFAIPYAEESTFTDL